MICIQRGSHVTAEARCSDIDAPRDKTMWDSMATGSPRLQYQRSDRM